MAYGAVYTTLYRRCIAAIFFLLFFSQTNYSQEINSTEQIVRVLSGKGTIQQHIDYIDQQIEESVSYSSSRFAAGSTTTVADDVLPVREYLDQVLFRYEKAYVVRDGRILIVIQGERTLEDRRLFGYIRDLDNGEVLSQASVQIVGSTGAAYTNSVGYYNINAPGEPLQLSIRYLGYSDSTVFIGAGSNMQVDISLNKGKRFDPVVIKETRSSSQFPNQDKIDLPALSAFTSVTGEQDLLLGVRANAAVQSGNEGQGGFYVRGGSPDQNLILLDGVAMYEVSHTAGIASIFNTKSIRTATVSTEGFDAKYGGRMSSVLDIHLKDGHYKEVLGSVDVGLFGGSVHLEGPLSEGKTAFNLAAKTSWVNAYIDQVLPPDTQYDDLDLDYSDITLKLSHRFTPTSRLSFTTYSGSDEVQLVSNDRTEAGGGDFFQIEEDNALAWGSRLYALNYEQVLGDKWLLRAHGGALSYRYATSSFYDFSQFSDGLGSSRSLQVESNSGIIDYSFAMTGDYYAGEKQRLTLGINVVDHAYRPVIKSTNTRENQVITTLEDSSRTYSAREWAFFVTDKIQLGKQTKALLGARLTGFAVEDKDYLFLEPRFLLEKMLSSRSSIYLSATRMTQNAHLLVNPGIGLPSDLWVPSTSRIAPEISDQITLAYDQQLPWGLSSRVSIYSKWQQNLLEYNNPLDLFYTILNNENIVPVEDTNRGWEDRVSVGTGWARGVEVSISRAVGRLTGWAAYSYAFNERQFDDINDGAVFPYRFDRRHDINAGVKYVLGSRFDVAADFVYGTGNALTLALTEILGAEGEVLLVPGPRNGFRLPSFHRMNLRVNYNTDVTGGGEFMASLAIYNIYNRLNPYYIYLYEDELSNSREFRQVSLFPLLPSLQLSYSF